MKKRIQHLLCLLSVSALGLTAHGDVIVDQWTFSESNGTSLAGALSNNGTSLGGASAFASVQGGTLEFISTNTNEASTTLSTFRNINLSTDGINSGLMQLSYDIVSANFANTDAADKIARIGFGFRDTDPTNNDLATVRLVFNGNDLTLDYTDRDNVNSLFAPALFPGNSLANLNIRMLADFDNAGTAGSVKVFYTLGAGPEVALVTDGILEAGQQIDEFRMIQQITNGGTGWRAGDTVRVDNLTVSIIPEPSVLGLLGMAVLALVTLRRR